jgi:hypothetical protein
MSDHNAKRQETSGRRHSLRFPPTSEDLLDETTRPYFLWWTHATVGDLKVHLAAPDLEERAYWMGALLREANSRDVWLFTTTAEIHALWPRLIRYLGRSREMWAWLLELPRPQWPPPLDVETESNRA